MAGTPFNLTVTAEDIQDNTVVGYAGTAHFSSTDTLAELPADTTLTNGVGVFSVTLNTQGSQSLTIVDATESSIRGTSSLIAVIPSHAPLAVTAFTPTATGFTAQFNKPFDPTLLNLYDDSDVYGPADLTLIGPGGEQVRGSLLLDSTDTSITFMKTGTGAAGLLAAGSYTATFRAPATVSRMPAAIRSTSTTPPHLPSLRRGADPSVSRLSPADPTALQTSACRATPPMAFRSPWPMQST